LRYEVRLHRWWYRETERERVCVRLWLSSRWGIALACDRLCVCARVSADGNSVCLDVVAAAILLACFL
jgi:hypothetical protein